MITKHTINGKPQYSFTGTEFKIKGKMYHNFGGHSTGNGYDDAVYYLRDEDGKEFEVTKLKLIKSLLAEK